MAVGGLTRNAYYRCDIAGAPRLISLEQGEHMIWNIQLTHERKS